jgi:inhibitor of KinA sporulation pathway (predicted exonuclease)
MNLKAEFSEFSGRRKKLGLAEAVRSLGLQFEGSHHRGIDDARNIARVVSHTCIGA